LRRLRHEALADQRACPGDRLGDAKIHLAVGDRLCSSFSSFG
jgi:hypothetical protein